MRAAILQAVGDEKLEISDDVDVVDPGPDEVRIQITHTGVCHSDLSGMNGTIPTMPPTVLGHEGAGVVAEVGSAVTTLAEGDHVIVSWMPPCGRCADCLRGQPQLCLSSMIKATPHFRRGGQPLNAFANTGTFAEAIVVPVEAAVKIDDDVPLDVASLIGCGVMTGVGAAINTAQVRPGSSVVVFGCGGVGISVIQGARIAGAAEIVAVDVVEAKLDMAKGLGATHGATPDSLPEVIGQLTGGAGFDYAFEAIGNPKTIRAAFDAVRRGGTAVVVGVGRTDQMIEFSAFEWFFSEKTIKGSMYGSADVRTDFHRLLRLWRAGQLDLEGMISRRGRLEDVNDALVAMQRGEVIRTVLEVGANGDGTAGVALGRGHHSVMAVATGPYLLVVDGEEVPGSAGTYPIVNPATEEVVAEAPEASAADAEAAAAAARAAQPAWQRTAPEERARLLQAVADAVRARQPDLLPLIIAETGATVTVGSALQVPMCANRFERYARGALSDLTIPIAPSPMESTPRAPAR